ncbi:MAG: hypothetical protein KH382_03545 [Clostridiales bacterium]|jgi:hypothetical protein|nr:hypothetical protein [Clostridiales bacterium]
MAKSHKAFWKALLIILIVIFCLFIWIFCEFRSLNYKYEYHDGLLYIFYQENIYKETNENWYGEYSENDYTKNYNVAYQKIGFSYNFLWYNPILTDNPDDPDFLFVPRGHHVLFNEDFNPNEQIMSLYFLGEPKKECDFTFSDLLKEATDINSHNISNWNENSFYVKSYMKAHPFITRTFYVIYYEGQYYIDFKDLDHDIIYRMNVEYIEKFCSFYNINFD